MAAKAIWIRVGDQGDYDIHGDVSDAGEAIAYQASQGGERSRKRWQPMKAMPGGSTTKGYTGLEIAAAGYAGDNYISVYWGDGDAQFVRPLSDAEFEELIAAILNCDLD